MHCTICLYGEPFLRDYHTHQLDIHVRRLTGVKLKFIHTT